MRTKLIGSYSETAPNQGTLQVFPDVMLSNTYIILRPFFKPISDGLSEADLLKAENWKFGQCPAPLVFQPLI